MMIDMVEIVRHVHENGDPLQTLKVVTAAFLSKPAPTLTHQEKASFLGYLEAFVIAKIADDAPLDVVGEALGIISLIRVFAAFETLERIKRRADVQRREGYIHLIQNAQDKMTERR